MTTPPTIGQVASTSAGEIHVDPNRDFPAGSMLGLPNPIIPTASPATCVAPPADDQNRTNAPRPKPSPHRQSKARRIIRTLYYHLHFKFPHLYFSRVNRVFQIARLSEKDLRLLKMLNGPKSALVRAGLMGTGIPWVGSIEEGGTWSSSALDRTPGLMRLPLPDMANLTPHVGPQELRPSGERNTPVGTSESHQWPLTEQLEIFEKEWTAFVDSASQEWTTLNIVSALLLSAVLSLLQMDDAKSHIVTRTFIFLSLSSAIISLILGCSYILKFSNMKTLRKAAYWVEVNEDNLLWNIWILLSLPAVWLAWSGIEFCVAILSLLWTMDPSTNNDETTGTIPVSLVPLSATSLHSKVHPDTLIPRVIVTLAFSVGLIHGFMVVKTFLAWAQVGAGVIFPHRPRAQTSTSNTTPNDETLPQRSSAPFAPGSSAPRTLYKDLPQPEGIQMEGLGAYISGINKVEVRGDTRSELMN